MDLLQRVARTVDRRGMLAPAARVGVAVSGGADSVCLLHVLAELAPQPGWTLHVLHLDHGLRGAESRGDAEFVRAIAQQFGLPVTVREVDLSSAAGNIEQAARRARLEFFGEMMASGVVERVAVGHTRSDQAETVLFRFLRGSGTAGLAGIRATTSTGIVRPLIDIDRADVERFLRERNLAWREDSSNSTARYARNRIRHELLPQLAREWNPAIGDTLAKTADWAAEEEAWWDAEVDRLAQDRLVEKDGAVLVHRERLIELPIAAARRLVRRAIERAKGDLRQIDFGHVEAVLELARGLRGHGRVQVPGVEVLRSFDWLRAGPANGRDCEYALAVNTPGIMRVPVAGLTFHMELIEKPETSDHYDCVYNSGMGCLDWPRLSGPLVMRSWKPGDRYQPSNSDGPQKIKTLFQKARIPLWDRRSWPVLTDGGAIVWARRFGPAAGYAAGNRAGTVLMIKEVAPA